MSLAGVTGARRRGTCETCGRETLQEQMTTGAVTWWMSERHDAPCGAPCVGGGVRPKRSDELPSGVSGIAHTHRADACGATGCGGGR